MALNLEKHLVFYGAYHHDPVNKGIHILCVPVLLATAFVLNTPFAPAILSSLENPYFPINVGSLLATAYAVLYVILDPFAGGILAPFILLVAKYGTHLTATYGASALYVAGAIHALAWIAQFIGHGMFEHRAPALLDNLVQALFLAPFFVWFEILFFFGFYPALQRSVNSKIEAEIASFRARSAAKKKA